MVSKITFLILFGIIILTNGNPAYIPESHYDLEGSQYDLKTLIEELSKQGKYDVILNHHEDHPESHHEDTAKISYNGGKSNSPYNNAQKYRTAESYQGSTDKLLHYNYHPKLTSIQNLNVFLRKKHDRKVETNNNKANILGKAEDEVATFLDELDQKLKLNGRDDLELRCFGDRCGGNRDEASNNDKDDSYAYNQNVNNYDSHLRCNGMRCSVNVDDDRNDGDSLRCYGNKCSRKSNDNDADDRYDNIDISKILRCTGNNCGINRDDNDDRNGLETSRCVGNRCGAYRTVADDDNYNDEVYTLRCNDRSCSIITDDSDYVGIDHLRFKGKSFSELRNDDYGIVTLRCLGDRCSRISNDDDNDDDNNGIYSVRCTGKSCSINRDDADDEDDDNDGRHNSRCNGKSCSRNRNDDNDDKSKNDDDDDDVDGIDNLRCNGKSCNRNRNYDDDDGLGNLRCNGKSCNRNRNDDDDDDNDGLGNLRCNGKSCTRNRNGDYAIIFEDDTNDNANDRKDDANERNDDRYVRGNNLRCIGDRCGRSGIPDENKDRKDLKVQYQGAMKAVVDRFLKLGLPIRNVNVS